MKEKKSFNLYTATGLSFALVVKTVLRFVGSKTTVLWWIIRPSKFCIDDTPHARASGYMGGYAILES